ncbi:MAG: hypothetical protein JEZ02_18285 [Desulfatibacillum sp.]|nr:hypothetical protein [Desulfatibacillum sp.]
MPPIFRVDTTNNRPALEIGQELGAKILAQEPEFAAMVDTFLSDTMDMVASAYNSYFDTSFDAQSLFNDMFNNPGASDRVPDFVADMKSENKISQKYLDEVQGMASFLGLSDIDALGDGLLSENEFWLYQMNMDVLIAASCSGFGVYGNYSAIGSPIVGRNLDLPYVTTDTIKMQSITVYEGDNHSFANVGFMGMVGTITGIRSDGLFGAIIGANLFGKPVQETGRHSLIFDMRYALENLNEIGVQEGATGIHPYTRDHIYYFSHSLLLADTSQVIIQEHPCGKTIEAGDPLPARLRGWEADQYPTTVSWGNKRNMVAVTTRFVLPPMLPYQCEDCPSECYKGSFAVAGMAKYSYYSLDHSCDAPLNNTCYDYSENGEDECQDAGPKTNCWEYCNRSTDEDAGDFWPGTPNLSFFNENFDRNGYYPIGASEQGGATAEKWDRFYQLANFTPNTQTDPNRAASYADVAAIMTDTQDTYDPILAYGTGIVYALATIQSMVYSPVEGRFFLYTIPSAWGHAESPYMEEISLFNPMTGDINGSGLLELEDAILCLQAVAGGNTQNVEKNGIDEKLDMETALYVLQKKAELRY